MSYQPRTETAKIAERIGKIEDERDHYYGTLRAIADRAVEHSSERRPVSEPTAMAELARLVLDG